MDFSASCFHGLLRQFILHKQALELVPSQVHIHAFSRQTAAFLILRGLRRTTKAGPQAVPPLLL
jgi:hypothetical protein